MAVSFSDVQKARAMLEGVANKTPVVTSRRLDTELGCSLFFKCENLQRVGAFKFRGAYNALGHLDAEARRAGVVAYSSGNHAQAVALAASLLGISATIVMPTNAPRVKLAATRGYGARVVTYDPQTEDRAEVAERIRAGLGAVLIPPFDHPLVIAGQATAAAELIDEVSALDLVITPVGGGGLLAGTTLAVKAMSPLTQVFGAEPADGDDAARSLKAGQLLSTPGVQTHLADGARTESLGDLTWPIIQDGVTAILTVDDAHLVRGLRDLMETLKLVVEPTAALVMPAVRVLAATHPGSRVGVLLSGGNLDLTSMTQWLDTGIER